MGVAGVIQRALSWGRVGWAGMRSVGWDDERWGRRVRAGELLGPRCGGSGPQGAGWDWHGCGSTGHGDVGCVGRVGLAGGGDAGGGGSSGEREYRVGGWGGG